MMYNRYVPDATGIYRPTRVEDAAPPPPVQPPVPPAQAPEPEPAAQFPPAAIRQDPGGLLARLLPRSIDTGDLLMLLILLLLAVDGEEEGDPLSVLLTAAAFLLS